MSSGMSVTDIAAKISLDYSAYMQGIKMVESRAVDMAKFIANPPAASRGPDQGARHVIDRNIEMSAVRNRIDSMRFAADRERKAAIDNAKATAEAEKEIAERSSALRIAILARYGAEADAKRERARQLDNKAYEEGKRIQQQAVDDYMVRKNNEATIDQEVQAGQEQAANEAKQAVDTRAKAEAQITTILDKQKAKNDEIYAQHLRDRKARSDMAAALKAGREAGVPNNVLKDAADQFKLQQAMERRARQDQKDIEAHEALLKLKKEDAHVTAYKKNLQDEENDSKMRAERIIRSLMTAQDLHNERVKEYTRLLGRGKLTQDQFNDAVEASKRVMTASNAGAGRFSGAMTQLSFAAEDFIQVSAMGGGLNMALMSASNNMSMFVRAMLPAAGLLSSLAGAVVPLAAIGIGMYVQKTMQAKDSTEALNKELERFLRNAQQDLRLQALFSFEDTQNVSSASEAMSRAADASREMKKAQLEQKLAQNAVNSSLESFIMSLEEARKLTNAPLASEEFEYYQMAFEEYKKAFNEVMNSGMKTEQDARTALTRYMTSLSQYPTIFAEQIDLIRKILNDPEGNALEAFRQLEEQNARLFNAQQEMEESRKRALDLARQELQMKQEEEMLVLRMNEEEKQRYNMSKQQKEFVGFDPMAVAGLGLAGILNAGQGMAAGMQFLEAQAANLEKEIAALQESSSPEVIGGMQQDAFQAQADAFKQIFAAENKQPNPQLTRQIQLLADIRAAIAKGGVLQVVGQ
jgi:hypothetical protein